MYTKENTLNIKVGNLTIGGNNHIVIQSMCNIKTCRIDEVVNQILRLEHYGCEMVRLAIFDMEDAKAIKEIKKKVHIPLVADIHYDYRLALASIENGIDKVRINPGNIGSEENVLKVVNACKEHHVPIRIGINSGSLEKDLEEKYGVSAKTMIESAKRHVAILEKFDFHDIVISLKSSNYKMSLEAYKLAAETFPYPLHIGITEPGPMIGGIIKSTLGLSELLDLGIGNTMRISLSDDPVEEIKVAKQLLLAKGLITMPNLVSCPTCGRTTIDLIKYDYMVEDYLYTVNKKMDVALMGCVVNGLKEGAHADIGIAISNKEAILFKKGKVVKMISEDKILDTLKEEIEKM